MSAVVAWPWIWLVPGYFFARKVLRAEGFALAMLSLATSIAFVTVVSLPLVVLRGRPAAIDIVVSVIAFAFACAWAGARAGSAPCALRIPWPHASVIALVLGFVALLLLHAVVEGRDVPPTTDARYLLATVRALATSFPPENPVAAGTIVKQPWGYWMLYALTHVASGVSAYTTMLLGGVLVAIAQLTLLYALVFVATKARLAGGLAVVAALGASDVDWLVPGARDEWAPGMTTSAGNLVAGWYNGPALVVLATALLFFSAARDRLGGRRSLTTAAVLFAVLPFFHPVVAVLGGSAVVVVVAIDAARGRLATRELLLAGAPLPFLGLYVLLYARGVAARAPFVPTFAGWSERVVHLVRYVALYLPLAVVGAATLATHGTRRVRARVASLAVALCAVAGACAVFGVSFARNYHWTHDPVVLGLVVLGGVGIAALLRHRPSLGVALGVVVLALALVGAGHGERLETDLGRLARPPRRGAPPEAEAGAWIASHTSRGAVFVVDERSLASVATVLSLGERHLYCGPHYLLATTMSDVELDDRARTNRAILTGASPAVMPRSPRSPRSPEASRAPSYVLLERNGSGAIANTFWSDRTPRFANAGFMVFDAHSRDAVR